MTLAVERDIKQQIKKSFKVTLYLLFHLKYIYVSLELEYLPYMIITGSSITIDGFCVVEPLESPD